MAVHEFNTVGKFQDRGCLNCGEGSALSSDKVLGVAETFSKRILSSEFVNWRGPRFAIRKVPTKASLTIQPNALRQRKSVFYPHLERTRWYDPVPVLSTGQVDREVINADGQIDELAFNHFDHSSIACAPPLGPRGISGKDASYSEEFWTNFQIGPFCLANYRLLEDLAEYFQAAEEAVKGAIEVATQYKKLDQFITMSLFNASAVAGTYQPKFSENAFTEFPDSSGNLEWVLHCASIIGSQFPEGRAVKICCSGTLLEYWITDFARRKNVVINVNLFDIRSQVKGYNMSFTDQGQFSMVDLRTNRKVIFDTSDTPVYKLIRKTGNAHFEHSHQPWATYRLGDDTRDGEQNGIVEEPNRHFGDPNEFHANGAVLAEQVLIYDEGSYNYEAPPRNPFAGKFGQGAIMPTIGSADLKWYTGSDVDTYFLSKMADPATGICPNNRMNQWIAGEIATHVVVRPTNRYALGAMFFQVPSSATRLSDAPDPILCETRPAPITLTTPEPIDPSLCAALPEAPDDVPGCLIPQLVLNVKANASGDKVVQLLVERTGGFDGELTLDYETVADTALAGTHFTAISGTLTFAEGERYKKLDLTIKAYLWEDEDDLPLQFNLLWDGDLCHPYGGASGYEDDSETDTVTTITIFPAKPAYDNTPVPGEGCEEGEIA